MSTEATKIINDLHTAFEQFKASNDERLAQIEAKGTADAVLVQNVENANTAISNLEAQLRELETKANRPAIGPDGKQIDPAAQEHREVFGKFVRKGTEAGLRELEIKASLSVGTDADGGYAVPEQIDRTVLDLIQELSPMRSVASQITVGTPTYKKLVNLHGASSGWVGETAARTATDTPSLAEVAPSMGEIYAMPEATQQSLDDIFFNAEQWLANELATEFAQEEATAFVSGNGTNKPKGFLSYTTVATADASRTFGQLQHVVTGVSGDFAASNKGDKLIDLIHTMKPQLRMGAVWAMNTLTTAAVRKFKDGNGDYLWRPGIEAGQPAQLLGYPVVEMTDMPDMAANSLSVAFANFRRGYLIVDRIGTRVLRDPFTNKPYVRFYTTKRVGGAVIDSEAIKLLKFGT